MLCLCTRLRSLGCHPPRKSPSILSCPGLQGTFWVRVSHSINLLTCRESSLFQSLDCSDPILIKPYKPSSLLILTPNVGVRSSKKLGGELLISSRQIIQSFLYCQPSSRRETVPSVHPLELGSQAMLLRYFLHITPSLLYGFSSLHANGYLCVH